MVGLRRLLWVMALCAAGAASFVLWQRRGAATPHGVGAGWDLIATADGNADGKADFYWRNPTTGALAVWYMNGGAIQSTGVWCIGSGWNLVAVGDLNGDNHSDIFWRNPSTGALAYWFMNGATVVSTHPFGVGSSWVPLVPE